MAKKSGRGWNPPNGGIERLLSVSEVADIRQCCEKTIWRAIKAGKLPVIRTGRRVHVHPRYVHIDLS